MIERMIGAARLDVRTYEEVEADGGATVQALLVVVLVAFATAIGGIGGGIGDILLGVVWTVVGWALWAGVTYFVGTKLLSTPETEATWGQLARTLGFAQSVGVLRVFGIIPFVGDVIFLAAAIWGFVAMVIAVRQALDYRSTRRAVGVVVIGAIPYGILLGLLKFTLG